MNDKSHDQRMKSYSFSEYVRIAGSIKFGENFIQISVFENKYTVNNYTFLVPEDVSIKESYADCGEEKKLNMIFKLFKFDSEVDSKLKHGEYNIWMLVLSLFLRDCNESTAVKLVIFDSVCGMVALLEEIHGNLNHFDMERKQELLEIFIEECRLIGDDYKKLVPIGSIRSGQKIILQTVACWNVIYLDFLRLLCLFNVYGSNGLNTEKYFEGSIFKMFIQSRLSMRFDSVNDDSETGKLMDLVVKRLFDESDFKNEIISSKRSVAELLGKKKPGSDSSKQFFKLESMKEFYKKFGEDGRRLYGAWTGDFVASEDTDSDRI